MQRIATLLGLFAVIATVAGKKPLIDEEGNVLVLNSTNFEEATKFYKYLLVEFYAPWCGHCKEFKPDYEKVATILREEENKVRLAKVDATTETDLADRFEVKGYPTLKFFVNGTASDYTEDRKVQGLVRWLRKQVGSPFETVISAEELSQFLAKHKTAVVGVLHGDSEAKRRITFDALARRSNLPFALVEKPDEETLGSLSLAADTDAFLVVKHPEEGIQYEPGSLRVQYPEANWTSDEIYVWLSLKSLPLVIDFSSEVAPKIFSGVVKHQMLLFDVSKRAGHEQLRKEFTQAAAKFHDRVLFIVIDSTAGANDNVLSFFGVESNNLPQLRFVIMNDDIHLKYRMEQDFATVDAGKIQKFVEDVLAERISPYRLKQKQPADWNKRPVKKLVTSTFEKLIKKRSKHLFINIYAPWCRHCQALAPAWEQLGEWFKHRKDIIIAKMDGTKNEPEGLQLGNFPALKWYPKNSNETIDYSGDRSIDSLKSYVESLGAVFIKQYAGEFDTEIEGQDEFGMPLPVEKVDKKEKGKSKKEAKM